MLVNGIQQQKRALIKRPFLLKTFAHNALNVLAAGFQ